MAKFRECFKQQENFADGRIFQPVSLKTEFSSLKHWKYDFKNIINLGGKQDSRHGTTLKLERGELGTFALILPLQSVTDQDHRLVWKKQCPLLFLWELDTSLITLHITYLQKKVEEQLFLAKDVRKEKCISPFKGRNFEQCGFEWLSFSSNNKYSAYVSTCKAALVNN